MVRNIRKLRYAPHVLLAASFTVGIVSRAAAETKHEAVDFWHMGLAALAGLVLFFFGVSQLANGLSELNTDRMRRLLARFTSNRFASPALRRVP
jgi:hypothetical protein